MNCYSRVYERERLPAVAPCPWVQLHHILHKISKRLTHVEKGRLVVMMRYGGQKPLCDEISRAVQEPTSEPNSPMYPSRSLLCDPSAAFPTYAERPGTEETSGVEELLSNKGGERLKQWNGH